MSSEESNPASSEIPDCSNCPCSPENQLPCGAVRDSNGNIVKPHIPLAGPISTHILFPDPISGEVPECSCKRTHIVYGQKYEYCTCGRTTATQPFCDGFSHLGTPFKPLPFVVDRRSKYTILCPCKKTSIPPYCDGRHSDITKEDLEW